MRTLVMVLSLAVVTPAAAQNWQLVWSDEFDGTELDTTKWSYDLGDGCPDLCGWGNAEEQYYSMDNVQVSNGVLSITARREEVGGRSFTSGRIASRGKGDWTYGRFEARAKLPRSKGFWPAIWMLPTDNVYGSWAASGEIDIMEARGDQITKVHGTLHYGGSSPQNVYQGDSYTLPLRDFSRSFHDFAIEWVPGEIRWYVDGNLYHVMNDWYTTEARFPAPFDQDFHVLLNLAIGGTFGGSPDASSQFPQAMEIEYVRVYQSENQPPTATLTSPRDGSAFSAGGSLTFAVDAQDSDGTISSVSYYAGDALLAVDRETPYEWTVSDVASGCYELRARVVDNLGGQVWTDAATVTVDGCGQAPYRITREPLPGRVEAEYFDLGGEGEAYSDLDASNPAVDFRASEGVDLAYALGVDRGWYVTDFQAGEWMEYQVQVAPDVTYDLDVRVASQGGGALNLLLNGQFIAQDVVVPVNVGATPWFSVRVADLVLPGGPGTLRLEAVAGPIDVDYITFRPHVEPPPAGTTVIEDFGRATSTQWQAFGSVTTTIRADGVGLDPHLRAVYSGSGGNGSAFYGVIWRNFDDSDQPVIPADPWFSARVRHGSAVTTVDSYTLEITLREDVDGNGWTTSQEDSHRFDTRFSTSAFNDEWIWVSAPLSAFMNLGTGGNGFLEGNIDEVVFVVSGVSGPNPSSVQIDIDQIVLSTGPFSTGVDAGADLPDGIQLGEPYPNPTAGRATLPYSVDVAGHTRITLFDVLGRQVAVLADHASPAGAFVLGVDVPGLTAGVYLVRLEHAGRVETRRLVVAR